MIPIASIAPSKNRIRLETLTTLRWAAVFGQIASIIVAYFIFDIEIHFSAFSLVISFSILMNLYFGFVFPKNRRLSEQEATLILLVDAAQLTTLLYLFGGINNPFSLLLLAPVSIAATALRPKLSIIVGAAVILLATLIGTTHLPLSHIDGTLVSIPDVLLFGNWAALFIGVLFIGIYSWRISSELDAMSEALFATQMALSREHELTGLGGVVAATAHELGTPLATIKLVSSELVDELDAMPAQKEDAQLIREQAVACGEILKSMGKAGKDDTHMKTAPLQALVEEAATPHMNRGKIILFELLGEANNETQPYLYRKPEIIHGIRNLIQNAVDYSTSTVWVEMWWDDEFLGLKISDNGPGFPNATLGRLGDPFISKRRSDRGQSLRPEYEGMGLGLFISKTLLERYGAKISFTNSEDDGERVCGAIVTIKFPRSAVSLPIGAQMKPLEKNQPF